MRNVVLVVVLSVATSVLFTGCAHSGSGPAVEYRLETTSGGLTDISYSFINGLDGATTIAGDSAGGSWSKRVDDGGSVPSVSARSSAGGTTTCEIRDGDGRVLDSASADAGATVRCSVERSDDASH